MRVYVAGSAPLLRELVDTGVIAQALEGFAATQALRSELGQAGEDEVEFALSLAAAESSAAMLGGAEAPSGTKVTGRRFVIVAELSDDQVTALDEVPGAVSIAGGLALRHVDSVLADPADLALHAGISDDLAWFATQEIPDLLA